jgi:endonuclease-3 related protein
LVIEAKETPITQLPNYAITGISSASTRLQDEIIVYYRALLVRWGPQNWWPARSRLEVIVGAYLTQNTSWSNVEKAISNLRQATVLSVTGLRQVALRQLEKLLRPSGYFRQKAKKLKTFIRFLDKNYGGSIDRMLSQPTERLREELLALNGVGPETADSILLYAGNHPVFVVDVYTRRVLERHGIIAPKTPYDAIRTLLEEAVTGASPEELGVDRHGAEPRHPISRMSRTPRGELAQHYNELHALVVRVGNQYCRSTPRCEECPLREFLPQA